MFDLRRSSVLDFGARSIDRRIGAVAARALSPPLATELG